MIDKLKRVAYVEKEKGFERQRPTPTPLRPVDTYTLYYRREETKYNRSGWRTGKALAFKAIGRGFFFVNCEKDKALAGGKPPIYD